MSIAIVISSFLSGLLGSMGFGAGSVLIIYLTTFAGFSQKQAQGINLMFFLPIAILSVIIYRKERLIDFRKAFSFILPCLIGCLIGYRLLELIDSQLAAKLFGTFLAFMGIKQLFSS